MASTCMHITIAPEFGNRILTAGNKDESRCIPLNEKGEPIKDEDKKFLAKLDNIAIFTSYEKYPHSDV